MNYDKDKKSLDDENNLYQTILQLKNLEECRAFFRDLCTPTEIKAFRERWLVARILHQYNLSYREINEKTGISISTIGRVARYLYQENYGGYRRVLAKQNNSQQS